MEDDTQGTAYSRSHHGVQVCGGQDEREREVGQLEHCEERWSWRPEGGEEEPGVSAQPLTWGHGDGLA